MKVMKAFTVWQPWASLIMAGLKPYEFRGWPLPQWMQDKRVVVHAGSRPVRKAECMDLLDDLFTGKFCGHLNAPGTISLLEDLVMGRKRLPLAAGLGSVKLGKPVRSSDLWPEQFQGFGDSDRVEHSNWAWPISDIKHFEPIVPTPGRQGFWNWPWEAPQ